MENAFERSSRGRPLKESFEGLRVSTKGSASVAASIYDYWSSACCCQKVKKKRGFHSYYLLSGVGLPLLRCLLIFFSVSCIAGCCWGSVKVSEVRMLLRGNTMGKWLSTCKTKTTSEPGVTLLKSWHVFDSIWTDWMLIKSSASTKLAFSAIFIDYR